MSGNLAKYGDGAETDRHGLSEQAGKTRTHPKAGPQPAEVQTQTGLYNGGNTCYQNSGFQMVLSSSAAREALSQALQSGNLGGTEICKILSDMFQSVIAEDFGESKTQLRLFWAELREQGSMFKPGRQQDAEEFLTSCLGPEFADVLTTAWGYRSVQVVGHRFCYTKWPSC